MTPKMNQDICVAVLTGGSDPSYVFGLGTSLMARGARLDIIGNDELAFPEFVHDPAVNYLNLRGDQRPDVGFVTKVKRILHFYARMIRYAMVARPRIFHILWNNKFEIFDRTLLTLFYKLLGKKIVLTVHNVNMAKRDQKDSSLNRLSLRIQYRLADHLFVHTEKMKSELVEDFGVSHRMITVIPFGINNSIPVTGLTRLEARARLGIGERDRTLLFYGRIKPYKGLEYLLSAFHKCLTLRGDYKLVIAGEPHACAQYWADLKAAMQEEIQTGRIILRIEYVPDGETEIYFKAADVSVLPYREIYQSGVLFLSYSFGLPVIASDVGSLSEDIVEGRTGFVFRPEDPDALARAIESYFASDLFAGLVGRRREIIDYATEKHSWDVVAQITLNVYAGLLGRPLQDLSKQDESSASFDLHASP